MAFTTTDIVTLQAAIATGAMKVEYADGRRVTYRSLAEMREILGMMQRSVAGASGNDCRSVLASF